MSGGGRGLVVGGSVDERAAGAYCGSDDGHRGAGVRAGRRRAEDLHGCGRAWSVVAVAARRSCDVEAGGSELLGGGLPGGGFAFMDGKTVRVLRVDRFGRVGVLAGNGRGGGFGAGLPATGAPATNVAVELLSDMAT
jgi:hypothetical protein